MNRISYSFATGAFYHADLHGTEIPADAIAISDHRHRELLALRADGAAIELGASGKPVARRPRATLDQLRAGAIAAVKAEAARRIEAVAPIWRQLNDMAVIAQGNHGALEEQAYAWDRRHQINAVRTVSNAIEATIATLAAAELRTLDVAGDARWPTGA